MSGGNSDQWLCAVAGDTALTTAQKAVAMALWSYMDRRGVCWPSVAAIGERAGISTERAARHALKDLEAAGYIRRTLQPNGRKAPNSYSARLPEDGKVIHMGTTKRPPKPKVGGSFRADVGGHETTPLGVPRNDPRTNPIELRAVNMLDELRNDPGFLPRP